MSHLVNEQAKNGAFHGFFLRFFASVVRFFAAAFEACVAISCPMGSGHLRERLAFARLACVGGFAGLNLR